MVLGLPESLEKILSWIEAFEVRTQMILGRSHRCNGSDLLDKCKVLRQNPIFNDLQQRVSTLPRKMEQNERKKHYRDVEVTNHSTTVSAEHSIGPQMHSVLKRL